MDTHQIERTLEAEITSTGQAARDAINSMAQSFDNACAAFEQACRAWEEAAPLK